MTTTTTPLPTRTWDVEITIGDETFAATPCRWDTLRETVKAARDEAAEYLRAGLGTEAALEVFKTTKARGRESDRTAGLLWMENGALYIDRAGC